MNIPLRGRIEVGVLLLLWGGTSQACPLCHTATADEVRKGLSVTMQDLSVWSAVLLPFAAVAGVIRLVNSGWLARLTDHTKRVEDE